MSKQSDSRQNGSHIVILSAKTDDRRAAQVEQLIKFLDRNPNVSLANLAFTLQVGREEMPSRVAIVTDSIESLKLNLVQLRDHDPDATSNRSTYVVNKNEANPYL